MAAEYQKWPKIAQEMGYSGDELRSFVKERQEVCKAEKIRLDQLETQRLAAESEAAAKKSAVELEQKKLTAELEAKRLAAQVEERRLEAELEQKKLEDKRMAENREDDLKKIEIESQERIRLRELDTRLAYENRQEDRVLIGQGARLNENDNGIKNIKMPVFKEDRDCLDAYLLRFERSCMAFKVNKDLWALALARSLEGRSLEVYERLEVGEAQNYERLKKELLKRF